MEPVPSTVVRVETKAHLGPNAEEKLAKEET